MSGQERVREAYRRAWSAESRREQCASTSEIAAARLFSDEHDAAIAADLDALTAAREAAVPFLHLNDARGQYNPGAENRLTLADFGHGITLAQVWRLLDALEGKGQ